jgi:hypothetical protein
MTSSDERQGDRISGNVSGPVQGQVAIGKSIRQEQSVGEMKLELSEAERAELGQAFTALRSEVEANAPPETRPAALERVDELEEAVVAAEPDVTTMGYVKKWFTKNLPTLAGSVVGVLVNPIVGKIVQSAGDAAMTDLQRAVED